MGPELEAVRTTGHTAGYSYLFNHNNLSGYSDAMTKGIALIRKRLESVQKPFSGVLPHELAGEFRAIDLDQPLPELTDALEEIERLYLDHAIYFHHPRYVAHLNCPIVIPSILAELILSSVNSSLDTWDQSAGGTFIEQKLIDWTTARIGLGQEADGIFTSGGTQSNLMAMLLARDRYCQDVLDHNVKTRGLPAEHSRLRIFASQASHFSIQKALAILGLGYDAVIPVPYDKDYKMDTEALTRAIEDSLTQGLLPCAVVGTAGTTDFGSIDPLQTIASICKHYRLWMHVDAAYGCGLLLSHQHKHLIDGIEYADSVTVDYHKSFFQPVSCSAFFVRDKKNLSFVTHHADYLNPLSQLKEGTPNLVNKSIQTTRRFDALKLWLTLRTTGADNLGRAFDQVIDLARRTFFLLLSDESMEVLHQPELSTLIFRYRPSSPCPDKTIDDVNVSIRKALFRSGEGVIAGTKVGERQYLKFTLLNPATTLHDIQEVIGLIHQHGQHFFEQSTSK